MPVIVDEDHTRATALSSLIGEGTHAMPSVGEVETWVSQRPDEYVVVMGPNIELQRALDLSDRLRVSRPTLSTLLIRPGVDAETLQRAMLAGVREVVPLGDAQALLNAVHRSRQTFEAISGRTITSEKNGKTILVFSPKGGVGKTTMAVNLALALNQRPNTSVCLVDLDLEFGDVAISLQMVPEHTIDDALAVLDSVDMTLLTNLLAEHESGLKVLAAPTHPDAKDSFPATLIRRVITTLQANFDYIVIDTSPGFDNHTLHAFDEADECVIMATLDVPTIKNVKMALETLDVLDLAREHRWLVVNRADPEIGLTEAQVESILSMQLTATIPSSLDVVRATNHGQPIALHHPDAPFGKAVQRLTGAFAQAATAPEQPVAAAAKPTKKALFGRRKNKE